MADPKGILLIFKNFLTEKSYTNFSDLEKVYK